MDETKLTNECECDCECVSGSFWKGFALFLLGMVIGFLLSPAKNGCFNNNGNNNGNYDKGFDIDDDEDEELDDEGVAF